jgi:hypothetical protein
MGLDAINPTAREDPAHGEVSALREKLWYPDVDGVLFDEAARCFGRSRRRCPCR